MADQQPSVVELQARWEKIRVANLYDTLDSMGYGNQCLDLGIKPLFSHQRMAGQVITAAGAAYPVPKGDAAQEGWAENYFDKLRSMLTSVRDKSFELREIKCKGRFGGLMRIGDETTNDIDHEVGHTAMTGVFDLRDILKLINDGL